MLLEKSAIFEMRDRVLGIAFRAAAERGQDEIVQALPDKRADARARALLFGRCGAALQAASAAGHAKIVHMLLDKGADLNAQGGEYGKPLQTAVAGARHKIVRMFLDKAAALNAQAGYSIVSYSSFEVVEACLPHIETKHINFRDFDHETMLHRAADRGFEELAKRSLELGADPLGLAIDLYLKTPLYYMAGNGHLGTTKLLLEAGSSLIALDSQGRTTLAWAQVEGSEGPRRRRKPHRDVIDCLEGCGVSTREGSTSES